MKRLIQLVLNTSLLIAFSFPRDVYVDERTNTGIYFSVQERIFPKHWYYKRINAMVEPLPVSERRRMITILNRAFSKYPDEVIRENLEKVYVFRTMKFYGVPYGGTNNENTIYLADDYSNPSFTDDYIEGVFHHELSSILLRSYSSFLDTNRWMSLNPKGFKYGGGGLSAIMNGEASLNFDPKLNEQGFLTRYSQSALEEDINMYAQHLFDNDREFWSILEVCDQVHHKATLLIEFYHRINPVFTEQYFRDFYRDTASH